ncbi:MAG: glycosyltransferase family 2 protein [Thermoprotei archaeon]|nr:MAG: glycosyltransferase family 2 protein [Thermoprotei archaeon]
MLDFFAITLILTHFGIPLTYYWYMKLKHLNKPWNIKIDQNYRPKVTVIVPTYNEAKFIQSKLNNIYAQNYPKNLIEIIVVDSASTDGTPKLAEEWASKHRNINMKIIRENERKGKAHALNHALKYVTGDIVIIADADAIWPSNALKEALKWFADPIVGAVSCLKKPTGSNIKEVEETYRKYYNILRIAESKAYSTPIFHGELAAFRKNLLEKQGGFPTDIGADDSHAATRMTLIGYRAIIPEDLWVEEPIPNKGYFWWKIRRAQHLIQHFARTLRKIGQAPKEFRKILAIETFLHLANPYLLLASTILLITNTLITHSLTALGTLALGITLLAVKQYRTWIAQQLHLIIAGLRNLRSKEIAWSKQAK